MTRSPSPDTVALSVIIATHDRAALVDETVRSLRAQVTPPSLAWEVLVVDNGSTDDTRGVIETLARSAGMPVRYVFEPRLGKSRAVNTGLAAARGSIVALTDDDVLPAPEWVACAARVLDAWQADGAGGRILPRWEAPAPDWVARSPRLLHRLGIMEHDRAAVMRLPIPFEPQIWGPNMVFRREVLQAVGGLDERRGPVGRRRFCDEDTELIRRVLERGHRVVYEPALTVHHRVPEARLSRAYFRRLEWDAGAGSVGAVAEPGPALLGAPRWRYRRAASALWRLCVHRLTRRLDALDDELELIESVAAICAGARGGRGRARSRSCA